MWATRNSSQNGEHLRVPASSPSVSHAWVWQEQSTDGEVGRWSDMTVEGRSQPAFIFTMLLQPFHASLAGVEGLTDPCSDGSTANVHVRSRHGLLKTCQIRRQFSCDLLFVYILVSNPVTWEFAEFFLLLWAWFQGLWLCVWGSDTCVIPKS